MIRSLAAASGLAVLSLAGAASAQSYAPSWGQPIYVDGWGRPVGGAPLSEVETRSYVDTGRWADGYTDRPHVVVPYPGRPARGYGHGHRHRGHGYGYGYRSSGARPYQGYRDEWGYQDDRPRPGRRGYVDRGRRYEDCGCGDVYLYDR